MDKIKNPASMQDFCNFCLKYLTNLWIYGSIKQYLKSSLKVFPLIFANLAVYFIATYTAVGFFIVPVIETGFYTSLSLGRSEVLAATGSCVCGSEI